MDEFLAKASKEKVEKENNPMAKRQKIEAQKVWISDLKDIDKIYKSSELRDIRLSVGA